MEAISITYVYIMSSFDVSGTQIDGRDTVLRKRKRGRRWIRVFVSKFHLHTHMIEMRGIREKERRRERCPAL